MHHYRIWQDGNSPLSLFTQQLWLVQKLPGYTRGCFRGVCNPYIHSTYKQHNTPGISLPIMWPTHTSAISTHANEQCSLTSSQRIQSSPNQSLFIILIIHQMLCFTVSTFKMKLSFNFGALLLHHVLFLFDLFDSQALCFVCCFGFLFLLGSYGASPPCVSQLITDVIRWKHVGLNPALDLCHRKHLHHSHHCQSSIFETIHWGSTLRKVSSGNFFNILGHGNVENDQVVKISGHVCLALFCHVSL